MGRDGRKRRSRNGFGDTALEFEYVALSDDRKTLVCKLRGGLLYELPVSRLAAVESWDRSGIADCRVIEKGFAALVTLRSGAKIDFAADFVLSQCEPRYRYFGAALAGASAGRAVRAMRKARGISIAELSRRTGIAASNLSRLESAKHVPGLGTVAKVTEAIVARPSR